MGEIVTPRNVIQLCQCHIKVGFLARGKQTNERGYFVVRKVLLEYIKIFCNPKEKQPGGKMGKVVSRQFSEGADKHTHDHSHKRLGDGDHNHDVRFHPDRVSTWQGLRAWLWGWSLLGGYSGPSTGGNSVTVSRSWRCSPLCPPIFDL